MNFVDIDEDSEINYTLAGYVMKVANMLIQQKPRKLLDFLYKDENKELIFKLCKVIYSKSMMSLAMLVINMKNEIISGNNIPRDSELYGEDITNKRVEVLEYLLNEMIYDTPNDKEKLEMHISASGIIIETIQHWNSNFNGEVILKKLFDEGKTFETLVDKLLEHMNNSMGMLSGIFCHIAEIVQNYQQESFSQLSKSYILIFRAKVE